VLYFEQVCMRVLTSLFFFQTWLLFSAFAGPGEDLLVSKLPSQFRMAAKVPRAILVNAIVASVKENRGLAPQVTAGCRSARARFSVH